jgi:hypothetical protein
MNQDAKIRSMGAKKAPEVLTVAKLVSYAEQIIRADKSAALKAQNNVSDLTAPSNDRRGSTTRISALDELCGKTGSVKIKSETSEDDEGDEKLIQFCKPRVGS